MMVEYGDIIIVSAAVLMIVAFIIASAIVKMNLIKSSGVAAIRKLEYENKELVNENRYLKSSLEQIKVYATNIREIAQTINTTLENMQ